MAALAASERRGSSLVALNLLGHGDLNDNAVVRAITVRLASMDPLLLVPCVPCPPINNTPPQVGTLVANVSLQSATVIVGSSTLSASSSPRFRSNGAVRRLLQETPMLANDIPSMIARGSSVEEWETVFSIVLPRLRLDNWNIEEGINLMRAGLRELDYMTTSTGNDESSSAVIEIILNEVNRLERQDASSSSSSLGPLLVRLPSNFGAMDWMVG